MYRTSSFRERVHASLSLQMSNVSFWSAACSTAMARDESALMRSFYAISSITIICSCATAIASGLMLFRWRQLDPDVRSGLWALYGAFTAIACFGSCVRIATWAVYVVAFPAIYFHTTYLNAAYSNFRSERSKNDNRFSFEDVLLFQMSGLLYSSAWQILYSVEFLCLCVAKLMVLDRMRDFSVPRQYKWAVVVRWTLLAIVILGCTAGVCGSIASAVTKTRTSSVVSEALSAVRARNAVVEALKTNSSSPNSKKRSDLLKDKSILLDETISLNQKALEILLEADVTDSVSQFSEMAILALLVACFLVVGVLCARRVRSALLSAAVAGAVSASAKRLHRQIVFTAAVVFLTFLPRAVFSSLKAVAGAQQDLTALQRIRAQRNIVQTCFSFCSDAPIKCSRSDLNEELRCCPNPFNQYAHMAFYLLYTPEFLLLTVLLSSLSQLVALWAMTSERMIEAFSNKSRGVVINALNNSRQELVIRSR